MTAHTDTVQHHVHHRDPSALAPEHVRRITPYLPGKPIGELAREFGLDEREIVKLASNENPRGPSPAVRAAIAAATEELCRYPDGNGFDLKGALSARYRVDAEQIVLGNGSNDILELVTQAFLQPGDHAVYSRHAFAVYPLATKARGGIGIEVAALDLGHDLAAMRRAITPTTRIVFVANPNNPTGTWLPPAALEAFIASVPEDTLVVLDEAYNEYLPPERHAPSAAWVGKYPNLIVSRTFSKAYGLAALRIGYGIMHARVADMLNRVRQPFNVNALAQAAALAALADGAYVEDSRALNDQGMRQLEAGLRALGVGYVPSHANFLLVEVGDAGRVYRRLLEQGVIVRPVANYALPEHLRVTIGLSEENRRFLAALKAALAG
jgi:histidinol-phosphate aminotransferase